MAENAFTRKVGPLPIWAWGVLGGIAVYFLYVRSKNRAGIANSPTATVLDPNAVDPTTGLTYGQELAGGFPASGNLQAGTGAGGGSLGSSTPAFQNDLTGPLTGFDQELMSFLQAQSDFGVLAGALGFKPPNPSSATTTAAASPPVQNTNPPGKGTKPKLTAPGAAYAPFGHNKPTAPRGFHTVGLGKGFWEYAPNATGHGQKTVHVANPAPHQTPVQKPNSTAKPVPVKHPAAGSTPGKVPSGSHQRVPSPAPKPGAPVHRGGPPARPPKRPAPRRPAPVRR